MTTVQPVRPADADQVAPLQPWTRRRRFGGSTIIYAVTAVAAAVVAAMLVPSILALPLAVLLIWPLALDSVLRPSFRRLALRNISRRKGEAALVVLGSLLGTAIITASFVVGDTIDSSLSDLARTRLGPVDETVEVVGLDEFGVLAETVGAAEVDGTDGVLRHVSTGAAVASTGDEPLAQPDAVLSEVDFDAARGFGGDPSATGLRDAGPTPSGDEAVINERLARKLEVESGDTIVVSAYGQEVGLTVRTVLPEVGLAGFGTVRTLGFGPSEAAPIFVAPGTVERLAEASTVATAAPPTGRVLVSNDGGVFDGVEGTASVSTRLEQVVSDVGAAEVTTPKQDMLDDAEASGDSIQELYFGIGAFSVIAGILLLVNLFVMLSEERKSEMGMLRALGFKRGHLARSFALEGAVYALAAAVLGAVLGIGVAWVMNKIASRIIAVEDPDLLWRLSVQLPSLVTGAVIGLTISLLTAWVTSVRISRLNIIAAIRDLDDVRRHGAGLVRLLLSVGGVVLGSAILFAGLGEEDPVGTLAGVPVMAFSAIPLLRRFLPTKAAVIGMSVVTLGWAIGVFTFFPDVMQTGDIGVFVVMGVILVSAAVAISAQVDHLWVALSDRLPGRRGKLAARLGLAYPVARKFRTGMLLGMYAIVIFTLTLMSVFINIFTAQAPTFDRELSAGYDVFVDSNRANPVTVDQLEDVDGVVGVAPLLRGFAEFSIEDQNVEGPWAVTGFDETLFDERAPVLDSRDTRFESDEAVFEAMLEDDSLAVVDDFFLGDGGGPPEQLVDAGDVITVTDPATGSTRELTVVGIQSSDFVFNGVYLGRDGVRELLGDQAVEARHYVRLDDGVDAGRTADRLAADFLANGVDASSFRAEIDKELAENEGFFALMRGYLALGLLIGIAGLGVVMVRAVRERRREIGMLRAMGVQPKLVRRAFLLEATFVALQGAVIGIALGLLTSYEVMVNSATFGEQALSFDVPWGVIALILVVPLAASLLAVAAPAAQASRIAPAEALRIAE